MRIGMGMMGRKWGRGMRGECVNGGGSLRLDDGMRVQCGCGCEGAVRSVLCLRKMWCMRLVFASMRLCT